MLCRFDLKRKEERGEGDIVRDDLGILDLFWEEFSTPPVTVLIIRQAVGSYVAIVVCEVFNFILFISCSVWLVVELSEIKYSEIGQYKIRLHTKLSTIHSQILIN